MTYDPNNGERFTYMGYDGQLHVREYPPDHQQWLVRLRNRMRLAELEQRRVALNESNAKTEVR